MFFISQEQKLSTELLQKFIHRFKTTVQPKLLNWENYYNGNQAILQKSYEDASKPCNRIVTNYCKIIADTYAGYICGKPVNYTSNDDISDVQEVINYNDDNAENIAWCKNALTYGVGYELQWLDAAAQVRYSQINPLNGFAIYDNTLDSELLYFVRWYEVDNFDDSDLVYVEVYSATSILRYETHGLGGSLSFIEELPNHFGDVPVSIFYLNKNEENIFNCIMSQQDAYNELQSSEVDDYQAWVDSYLVLQGVDAEPEDIAAMKANRVLLIPEGANAFYLSKNANDTQIENMLEGIKKNIFKVSACPDMADDNFLAQSGTALAYKLVGFENVASGIVAQFTKAIQRRIELICNILNIKATDAVWRDININFVRNLPENLLEKAQLAGALTGIVSDATRLSVLGIVDDVPGELEAIQAQKQANMSLYNFGADEDGDDE